MKSLILSLGFGLFSIMATIAQNTATLSVKIQDIASDDGMLYVGLYNSAGEWLEQTYKGESSIIANGKCEVVFKEVPYGEYAISVYHDENDNGKMDKYLGMIPKESYACSNQAPANFGPPRWDDAKFIINQETNQQIIKL